MHLADVFVPQVFGVPLYAQHEGTFGHLHALDYAVGGHGVDHKAACHVVDGLMVQAVDVQVLRGRAHDLVEKLVGVHRNLVPLDSLRVG